MDAGSDLLTAKGLNGQVTFDGKTVTIARGRLQSTHGPGTRTIPVSRITGVEVKTPSVFTGGGAFTLHIPGATEARTRFGAGRRNDRQNENTVQFNGKKQLRAFEALRDAIVAALA